MADVFIDFDSMDTLDRRLRSILSELEHASTRSADLQAAIGRPYGRTELRDRAADFEERWDEKRAELLESLEKIHEQVEKVIDGFRQGDLDMATGMGE